MTDQRTKAVERLFCRAFFIGQALILTHGSIGQTSVNAVTGSITGVIQTADGKGVNNATVAIRFRPTTSAERPPYFNADATTGAQGTFAVTNVPDGKYAICPAAPKSDLLPTCNWEVEPTAVVTNGKATSVPPITLKAGADFWVRVNDPHATRASQEGKIPGASLLLVVRTAGGRLIHIPLTATDGSGFDHHLTVPVSTDLFFTAFSSAFGFTNSAGASNTPQAANRALTTPVNIPASVSQHKEVITIQ